MNTQRDKRLWMIEQLLEENAELSDVEVSGEEQEQKDLLRALMNVRPPRPIDDAFLKVQDAYLSEENRIGGIQEVNDLPVSAVDERLILWQGDITTLRADAIVNAANSGMCGCFQPLHGCIDNIIHTKAGIQLRLTCSDIMRRQGHEEPTGQAKITPAYNLPCKYVIHTVGPIVQGGLTTEHERLLASCYTSCLNLAAENELESLAFCCISTGVFMFPNERAAEIAVGTVRSWLDETDSRMKVIFNVFKDVDLKIYEKLLN